MKAVFSLSDVDVLKRELASLIPFVKSSHRVEALARSLGFKSNAALRVELLKQPGSREVDDLAFHLYLNEHGFFEGVASTLGEAVIRCKFPTERRALRAAMDFEPTLTRYGLGVFEAARKTRQQREHDLQQGRAQLLTPDALEEFIRAVEFMSYFPKRQGLNTKATSYGLKHQAEAFHLSRDAESYVSNGALIAAAIHLGFNIGQSGPNAYFNLGSRQQYPVLSAFGEEGRMTRVPGTVNAVTNLRSTAWQNLLIAAINAGLEQKMFGLEPEDNPSKKPVFRFTFAGLPAIAHAGDAGYGELIVRAAVGPTEEAEKWIQCNGAGFLAGDAFVSGWLERTKGKWLQTSAKPHGSFRRSLLSRLAMERVVPNGYAATGPFQM